MNVSLSRLSLVLVCVLAACRAEPEPAADVGTFDAILEGRALDGRAGLMVFAPAARAAVLKDAIEQARNCAQGETATAEFERLIADHAGADEDPQRLYAALSDFTSRHSILMCTNLSSGVQELRVQGDTATGCQLGTNPGGEFRDELRFVRVDGKWYRDRL